MADHNPPHFHALRGTRAVQIKIANLAVLAGSLSKSDLRRVLAWAADHRDFLAAEWAKRN
jgi:hypothetical protein